MKNKKRWFSNLSIRYKVQYIFAVFMVITIVLCFIFFISITRLKITNTYREKNEDKLNFVEKSFSDVMAGANNISRLIMVNDAVLTYLRDDMTNTDKKAISDDSVRSELYSILNSFSGTYYVFVLKQRETENYHSGDSGSGKRSAATYSVKADMGIMKPDPDVLFSDSWYGEALKKNGGYMVVPNNRGAFYLNTNVEFVSFTRVINDMDTQKPIGLLAINIPVRDLKQTYENFASDDNQIAYVDSSGSLISSFLSQEDIDRIIDDSPELITTDSFHSVKNNRVISSRKISETGIYIICSSRISFFEDISTEMIILVLGMLVILIVTLLLISSYINRYIVVPVSSLSESMQMSEGEVPSQLENICVSEDEIGNLHKCYNEMTLKINRLLETVVEQEKQCRKAELTVIQEQMKPHFLYNTLDTIGYMALQNTREEVYDAIETLGIFYRKFLSKGSETIPLSDELSIVKSYIKLLRLRYDGMFEDQYEIEEGLESASIIKLILQPLVENSIYHGIRPKGESGIIKISVYSENNRMHIKVYDTGVGMSSEQIDKLLKGEDKKSFGFKGTIDRIKHFYQNDVYVSIRSEEGQFCEIDINTPFQHI